MPTWGERASAAFHSCGDTQAQRQSHRVSGILDSLRIRNEIINKHLQNVITVVDAKVNGGNNKLIGIEKAIPNMRDGFFLYSLVCYKSFLFDNFIGIIQQGLVKEANLNFIRLS